MYFKEENGYFNDGHETPAFLIWKGEIGGELIAGPMKESEALEGGATPLLQGLENFS